MRKNLNNGREYELEAEYGLPEKLPEAEKIIWQGSPDVWRTAKDIFYIRPVIAYFIFLVFFRIYDGIVLEHSLQVVVISTAWMIALSIVCVGLLGTLAYFTAKSAVYTITNRRIVMRIGMAMTLSFNLPFKEIVSADVKAQKDGYGNIPLKVDYGTKIGYFHLWPHVRPMNFNHPEPMLRNIANVKEVAALLKQAWATENQISIDQVVTNTPMIQPERSRQGLSVGLTNDLSLT
jgi:hypothetical protein